MALWTPASIDLCSPQYLVEIGESTTKPWGRGKQPRDGWAGDLGSARRGSLLVKVNRPEADLLWLTFAFVAG